MEDLAAAATDGEAAAPGRERPAAKKRLQRLGQMDKPKLKLYPFIVFCLIGTSALVGWNAMLNGVPGMIDVVYNVNDYSSTVTATYSTVVLVLTCIFIKWGLCNKHVAIAGQVLNFFVGLAFPAVAQWEENAGAGKALFHFLSAIFGVVDVLICATGYGFAGILKENYAGAVSAGQGVAGVFTFVVWMVSTYAIFDPDNKQGVRNAVWVLCVFVALLSAVTILTEVILFASPEFKSLENPTNDEDAAIELAAVPDAADAADAAGAAEQVLRSPSRRGSQNSEAASDAADVGTYEREGLMGVIKAAGPIAAANFFTLFITLTCFPVIGPLNWDNNNGKQRDALTGVFQVGDLVGRYVPNVLKISILGLKGTQIAAYMRVVFVALFMLCFKLYTNAFFGSFALQFILQLTLSLTNGWVISLCFMHASRTVEGAEARTRANSLTLLGCYVGIFAGQWLANGLILV